MHITNLGRKTTKKFYFKSKMNVICLQEPAPFDFLIKETVAPRDFVMKWLRNIGILIKETVICGF